MGYYIGYRETNVEQFLYITKTTEPAESGDVLLVHTIHNLKKFTEYTVHVKAYNSKGISPASENMVVFTLEDVPSQPPKDVQATPLSSRSIRMAWSPPPLYTLHGILQGYKVLYKPVREDEDESDANFVSSYRLEVILYELLRYTKYSVQVLAYTRKGEGVRSPPIYITTQQDVPEKPAAIKVFPANYSSIMVAWQPPTNTNGILTHYTLYFRNSSVPVIQEESRILPASIQYIRLPGLHENVKYYFRVTASTIMGEGDTTLFASTMPEREVPARIVSFPVTLTVQRHHRVTLPCVTVGWPLPSVQWSVGSKIIRTEKRYLILDNGSLTINGVTGSDDNNYTCKASNRVAEEHLSYMLHVQAGNNKASVPKAPRLKLVLTTTSTIQVNWLSGSNGGSRIMGFILSYKKEHSGWKSVTLGPTNRTYIASSLRCGTLYRFTVHANNRLGDSPDSSMVEAKTNGSVPVMPPQSMMLRKVNVTTATLDLTSWLTSGCSVRHFSVKYRLWGDTAWHVVNNHIPSNITKFAVQDLHPATWYVMSVVAHSDAGSTSSELKFATLTYTGSTIKPLLVMHKQQEEFYQRLQIMIPLCATIIVAMVTVVFAYLYCRRRRGQLRYKESSVNMRRDVTAETSLMNDLDKRFNAELGGSLMTLVEPYTKRDANSFISPDIGSETDLRAISQVLLYGGDPYDKSRVKNVSSVVPFKRPCDVKDEINVNSYASYGDVKEQHNKQKHNQQSIGNFRQDTRDKKQPMDSVDHFCRDSEEDNWSVKKATAAELALPSSPSVSYVPFFQTKEEMYKVPRHHRAPRQSRMLTNNSHHKKRPPGLPTPRMATKVEMLKERAASQNRGAILSQRRYASADHIHAIFSPPPRPQSAVKSGSGSSDKNSQRNSIRSSVTTVSSSRDELVEALENSKRHPPPPVLYESQPESSSQPTDSSVATEPGIRQFTQSPPHPNEQREASCEVPPYERELEKRKPRPRQGEFSSDTTECEGGEHRSRSPPRRTKGRNRGKQREKGHVTSKRLYGTTFMPRMTNSRNSTTSSDEITNMLCAGVRPDINPASGNCDLHPKEVTSCRRRFSPPCKTSKRPPAYPADVYTGNGQLTSAGKQKESRLPHSKMTTEHLCNFPFQPSTEEHKTMLIKDSSEVTSSPADDQKVKLLDRHYRPVREKDSVLEELSASNQLAIHDKGYTEDFTIV